MGKPLTLDHLQSKKKPVIRKFWLALDDEVAEAAEEARQKLAAAERRYRVMSKQDNLGEGRLAEAEKNLAEAEEAAEKAEAILRENAILMKFKSIGRKKFDDLIGANPATEEQKKRVEEAGGDPSELGWNVETFAPLLVALSSYEPEMSHDEVLKMWNDDERWNAAELGEMFNTALAANTQRRIIELVNQGNGSSGTRRSTRS